MLSDGLKYQDSRMATCEEMKQDLAPFALHDAAAKSKGGPVLLRDGDTVYTDPSDSHSLIVGDTGSMKTLRFVLPLIYFCAAAFARHMEPDGAYREGVQKRGRGAAKGRFAA